MTCLPTHIKVKADARMELGARPDNGLWMENSGHPAERMHHITRRAVAAVDGSRRQQEEEAAILGDLKTPVPVHDWDCPCQPCEDYRRRAVGLRAKEERAL